ncbi:hypothetical protein HG530_014801 [Fusarium avenaceum]|nr:hypothetical protein HG530_014801 [Fusarium avenaceum]
MPQPTPADKAVVASLMHKEEIRDCQWCQALSCTRSDSHHDTRTQLTIERSGTTRPSHDGRIKRERSDIYRAATKFHNEWQPQQVGHTLEERGSGEEVCGLRDITVKV